jgi:hypothetical protein
MLRKVQYEYIRKQFVTAEHLESDTPPPTHPNPGAPTSRTFEEKELIINSRHSNAFKKSQVVKNGGNKHMNTYGSKSSTLLYSKPHQGKAHSYELPKQRCYELTARHHHPLTDPE